jgi:hypothetical protein
MRFLITNLCIFIRVPLKIDDVKLMKFTGGMKYIQILHFFDVIKNKPEIDIIKIPFHSSTKFHDIHFIL